MRDSDRSDGPTLRDTLLEDYLQRALAGIDAGEDIRLDEICRNHPELVGALQDALGFSRDLATLQRAAAAQDPLAGIVLGERYRLETRIGAGAMGVVYRGVDQELQRAVAVKIIEARLRRDPVAEQRFLREAEVLASLRHPNLIGVFDRGTDAGVMYLVMEYVEGTSLAEILARGAQRDPESGGIGDDWLTETIGGDPPETNPLRLFARWCAELASGLAAAHDRGVLHRDVKPSNVLIDRDCRAVLIDFGIARRIDDHALTATDAVVGTPAYMAPELLVGHDPGPEADVYGLTATLYHAITLRPPYSGEPLRVLESVRTTDPTPAARLRPGLPRDVRAILDTGMERDPRRRFGSATALEADLRAFLDYRPVSVRPLGTGARAWRRIRRSPARLTALVAVVVVALVAALVPMWRDAVHAEEMTRHARLRALRSKLPLRLAFEGEQDRRPVDPAHVELLRQILELDPTAIPERLYSAALLLDRGEHGLASAHIDAAARSHPQSTYLADLAVRYSTADRTRTGVDAVDIDGIAEPVSEPGCYAAAFHELRYSHLPGWLDRARGFADRAGDLPGAALLRLETLVYGGRAQEAVELARAIERDAGPTGRTLDASGTALLRLRRYDEAVRPLLDADALCPGPYVSLHLGIALRQLRRFDEAREFAEDAVALRPSNWLTKHALAQILRDLGKYDEAYELVSEVAPEDPGSRGYWQCEYLMGQICAWHAIALLEGTATRERAEQARRADEHMAAAARVRLPARQAAAVPVYRELAAALGRDDRESAALAFLRIVADEDVLPLMQTTVRGLNGLLPPDVNDWSPELRERLRSFLRLVGSEIGSR